VPLIGYDYTELILFCQAVLINQQSFNLSVANCGLYCYNKTGSYITIGGKISLLDFSDGSYRAVRRGCYQMLFYVLTKTYLRLRKKEK
jgi:hypothetical protein